MELKNLLNEGEAVYEISRMTQKSIHIIGPETDDIDRNLDVSTCIEETLHRLIENEASEDDIQEILDASKLLNKNEALELDDGVDYYIDLDYVIYEFYPTGITETGVVFERPTSIYTAHHKEIMLCKNVSIPDDATDDEVLECLSNKFGIDADEYIVEDILNNGSLYGVQSLIDKDSVFILKKLNASA